MTESIQEKTPSQEGGQSQTEFILTNPSNVREYVEAIIFHRDRKEYHDKEQIRLREELKNLMQEHGLTNVRSESGTAYIGKESDEYSVPWRTLNHQRRTELIEWAKEHGMEESVHASTFSAFVRALVSSGEFNQADLPSEIKHYTKSMLNVRAR